MPLPFNKTKNYSKKLVPSGKYHVPIFDDNDADWDTKFRASISSDHDCTMAIDKKWPKLPPLQYPNRSDFPGDDDAVFSARVADYTRERNDLKARIVTWDKGNRALWGHLHSAIIAGNDTDSINLASAEQYKFKGRRLYIALLIKLHD